MLSITEKPRCSKCGGALSNADGGAQSDLCPTCWRLNRKREAEDSAAKDGGAGNDGAGNNAGAAGGDGKAAGV
jgi:hypothetical protein